MKNDVLKQAKKELEAFDSLLNKVWDDDTTDNDTLLYMKFFKAGLNTCIEPKEATKECKDCGTYSLCKLSGKAGEPCESWSGGEPKEQDVCPECGGTGEQNIVGLMPDENQPVCNVCNGTGKAPVDKIREAFEKTDHYKNAVTEHQELERYVMFIAGYKSQQAEIERLKCCGNCGKRYYYGIDTKCDEIRFLERNGSGKCSLWCLTYQPKENN